MSEEDHQVRVSSGDASQDKISDGGNDTVAAGLQDQNNDVEVKRQDEDYEIGSKRPLEEEADSLEEPEKKRFSKDVNSFADEENLNKKEVFNQGSSNEHDSVDNSDSFKKAGTEEKSLGGIGEAEEEHAGGEGAEGEEEEEGNDNEDDEEDEEDEDGDDDDEDDEASVRHKSRKRRANQFIDIEAEVDDEEEDELDEDDEEAELLRENFIADDNRIETTDGGDNLGDHEDDRLHRQFDRRRQEAEDQDAEELAETLKQRYRKTHSVYRGDTTTSGTVSQKLLMPSINDPAIYAIRCSPGREKDLVRKLYEKKRTLARLKNPLEILTVFQRDSFKGYIYVEAKKPEAIERALSGMVNIYAKQRLLVPVREYPDLLKQVKSSDVEIVPGIYVRITRGKYKNDLAIVDNLSENGLDVRCKLVPRLDYGKNDDVDKDGRKIKLKVRPIPRLFNEQEARLYDGEHLQLGRGPRSFLYRGEEYVEGFLFKDFKLQYIQTKDVHPRLEELDRFQTGNAEEDGLDLAAIAASLKNKNLDGSGLSNSFQPGDKVEIRRGEQAKTIGKVTSTSLNEVSIIVTDSGDPKFVNQKLTVPANDLRKVFTAGDHVRVIEGKHSEQTGLVIKIDNDSVILLSDQTRKDVRVFANYLIKATDASLNNNATGGKFDLKDLVQLNASTVGIIVEAEKDAFKLITSEGRLLSVKPSGIASKVELSRREQIATDKNGSPIKIGDTVKESLGEKKREGTIIHIYKNSLFIKLNEILENLGIFVANCMNVSTISTKGSMLSKNLGPDLSRMNPNLKLADPAANLGLRTRVGGRDKLISQDVVVNSGNYKGLMGKVFDADDTFARIELHSKSKSIKVNKTQLNVMVRGETIPYLRFIGASSSMYNPGPSNNSFNRPRAAPAFSSGGGSVWGKGGMTPAVGGMSSWGGGKTPAYNAGNSSNWGGNGAASAWGANGSTSSWGSTNNGNTSQWAKGNTSTWGNNKSGGSTWGGAGSTWGGAGSSWGGAGSTWGGASSWKNNKNRRDS